MAPKFCAVVASAYVVIATLWCSEVVAKKSDPYVTGGGFQAVKDVTCVYGDKTYQPGEVISGDQCYRVYCDDNANIQQWAMPCAYPACDNGAWPVVPAGECCPKCPVVDVKPVVCTHDGNEYAAGSVIHVSQDQCSEVFCDLNGQVQTFTMSCLAVFCEGAYTEQGECCPRCPTLTTYDVGLQKTDDTYLTNKG